MYILKLLKELEKTMTKEELKIYQKEWRKNNPNYFNKESKDQVRDWSLKRVYGITLNQYNIILESQNYCCKICNRHQY